MGASRIAKRSVKKSKHRKFVATWNEARKQQKEARATAVTAAILAGKSIEIAEKEGARMRVLGRPPTFRQYVIADRLGIFAAAEKTTDDHVAPVDTSWEEPAKEADPPHVSIVDQQK